MTLSTLSIIITVAGTIYGGFSKLASLETGLGEVKEQIKTLSDESKKTSDKLDLFISDLDKERVDISGLRGEVSVVRDIIKK